jgi:hypothetical protein
MSSLALLLSSACNIRLATQTKPSNIFAVTTRKEDAPKTHTHHTGFWARRSCNSSNAVRHTPPHTCNAPRDARPTAAQHQACPHAHRGWTESCSIHPIRCPHTDSLCMQCIHSWLRQRPQCCRCTPVCCRHPRNYAPNQTKRHQRTHKPGQSAALPAEPSCVQSTAQNQALASPE